MKTPTTSISDKIREAIRRYPSVYTVAKGSGVAHPVLSRFLTGERDIRVATAERLAEFLGLVLVDAPQAAERPAKAKGEAKGKKASEATAGKATKKGKVER